GALDFKVGGHFAERAVRPDHQDGEGLGVDHVAVADWKVGGRLADVPDGGAAAFGRAAEFLVVDEELVHAAPDVDPPFEGFEDVAAEVGGKLAAHRRDPHDERIRLQMQKFAKVGDDRDVTAAAEKLLARRPDVGRIDDTDALVG